MFLKAHNLCASRQANVPVNETLNSWLDSILIYQNVNNVIRVRNVIGARTPVAQMAQKPKCILEQLPWLIDIENSIHKIIGSMTDVKITTVLDSMDFLIG